MWHPLLRGFPTTHALRTPVCTLHFSISLRRSSAHFHEMGCYFLAQHIYCCPISIVITLLTFYLPHQTKFPESRDCIVTGLPEWSQGRLYSMCSTNKYTLNGSGNELGSQRGILPGKPVFPVPTVRVLLKPSTKCQAVRRGPLDKLYVVCPLHLPHDDR